MVWPTCVLIHLEFPMAMADRWLDGFIHVTGQSSSQLPDAGTKWAAASPTFPTTDRLEELAVWTPMGKHLSAGLGWEGLHFSPGERGEKSDG